MASVAIVYHSGFGHTKRLAEAVAKGAAGAGAEAHVVSVEELGKDAPAWKTLDAADAIIFGAPTYMGSYSAQFKAFVDASAHKWVTQAWKDKVAAGFTNSGSLSGDKLNTLQSIFIFAMQQSMIWVGLGELPPHPKDPHGAKLEDVNRLGSFSGVMAASAQAGADVAPAEGDLKTGELLGARVARVAARLAKS